MDKVYFSILLIICALIAFAVLSKEVHANTLHDTTKPHVCYTQGKVGVWVITPNGTYCQTK
jgi:hypothetical protein